MDSRTPYVVNLEVLELCDMTIHDWVDENSILMDELVSEAAEMLVADMNLESVTLIEIWAIDELQAIIEVSRKILPEALENNMINWAEREEYERAARSQAILKKIRENE